MRKIKDTIKKTIFWSPDVRLEAFFAMAVLGLLLVPLIRMAFYAVPWYDDYGYGGFVKDFLDQEYTLKNALEGALHCARTQWYVWQGTFSSIFFMAWVPVVWGEEYYFWGPLFLICILTIAVLIFVKVLAGTILKADRASAITLAAGVTAMVVVMIHQPTHGYYWYNAGIHYVGMHSFLLLLIAAWVRLLSCGGKGKTVLLMLWTLLGAVLAGGSNYVTSLQGALVGISVVAVGIILRKKRVYRLLPSMFVYAAALYINMSAPGNEARGAIYRDCGMSTDAVTAIINSFIEAFRFMRTFTWQMMLAVMVLLAPVIWRIVKNSKCRFCYPGILLLWSFCLYAAGFTSSLYVTGAVALARVVNAVKITYQILMIVNEIYWLGWVCRKLERRAAAQGKDQSGDTMKNVPEVQKASKSVPFVFYIVVGALMLGIFAVDPMREYHYSSWAAYYYVHTGEANEFHKQYLERIEAIKNGGEVVTVEPYAFRPWILATADLSEDGNNESNRAIAGWYGKQAVICSFQED